MVKLTISLDYDMADEARRDRDTKEVLDYRTFTKILIEQAFMLNHREGMDSKTARQFRLISKALEKATDDKLDAVEVSQTDFQTIYDEVYKARFVPAHAMIAPVLYDELDRLKARSEKDAVEGKKKKDDDEDE